jgi:methyl-accepting chemotaxis protein
MVKSTQAESRWTQTERWDAAIAGASRQVEGIQGQMRAQSLAAATLRTRYLDEFDAAVELGNSGADAVAAVADPKITEISRSANAADHRHDATVRTQLVPAVRAGDRAAALVAVTRADVAVTKVLAAARRIQGRVRALRAADVAAARSAADQARMIGLAAALIGTLAAAGLAVLMTRSIVRPLRRLEQVTTAAAGGDLTVQVGATARDEIGQVSRSFDAMVASLGEIVGRVVETARNQQRAADEMARASGQTGEAIGQIAATVEQVARGASEQAVATRRVTDTVEEMARGIQRVADGGQTAAGVAGQADRAAGAGVETVAEAGRAMGRIEERVADAADVVGALGAKSAAIGDIVSTIGDIASQTNLLALNAAIEAARAGEQGRGFAVVAEEVRKLAESTGRQAGSIAGLIGDIQAETERAVAAMAASRREADAGSASVREAGESFAAIRALVLELTGEVTDVAAAAQVLEAGAQQVQEDISTTASLGEENAAAAEEVSAATEETSAATEQVAATADEVTRSAASLTDLVGRFTF